MTDLRACVYGLAVGDALGVPFEFEHRGSFTCTGMTGRGTHNQPAGTFSDDTSLTLATCDSIRTRGTIDVDDMRTRFENWFHNGQYTVDGTTFDIGETTRKALTTGEPGSDESDNGNGSLMRIAPLAFTDASTEQIEAVSAITHAHEISRTACIEYVAILRTLIKGELPDLNKWRGLPMNEVSSTGFVLYTFNAALWCLANTSSYQECVLQAVNLGSDTDTTAAVAGALAGVLYGFDSIPTEWVETLRGRDIIDTTLF